MKRLGLFLSGAIFGTAFGIAVGFFIFPYVFAPPPASETLTQLDETPVLAQGTFLHADPSDPIHWGQGSVSVRQSSVFLEKDFKVGPGPAYSVYLVPKANIRTSSDVKGTSFLDLGPLRSFEGSQRYAIPAGTDLRNYQSVVIWCREFEVLISPASLTAL